MTELSWYQIRRRVWQRDGGICQVCQRDIPAELYECGHKVDRSMGGPDTLENCVAMCYPCNRTKPLHATPEEYASWLAADPIGQLASRMEEHAWSGHLGPHWESGSDTLENNTKWEQDRARVRGLMREMYRAIILAAWWGPDMSEQRILRAYRQYLAQLSELDRFSLEFSAAAWGWYFAHERPQHD